MLSLTFAFAFVMVCLICTMWWDRRWRRWCKRLMNPYLWKPAILCRRFQTSSARRRGRYGLRPYHKPCQTIQRKSKGQAMKGEIPWGTSTSGNQWCALSPGQYETQISWGHMHKILPIHFVNYIIAIAKTHGNGKYFIPNHCSQLTSIHQHQVWNGRLQLH